MSRTVKHINRLVMSFIRDDCGKLQELSKRMSPDLKAIATDASPKDSQEVIQSDRLTLKHRTDRSHSSQRPSSSLPYTRPSRTSV